MNTTLSPPKPVRAGVPQGTVLAPKLYTLYTSDVPTHPLTTTILYADDTAIYSESFYAQAANKRIQYHLPSLLSYYRKWKIRVNPAKTEQIILSKKYTNTRIIEPLKINDVAITPSPRVKYLGITLDKTLSFKPHVSSLLSRSYVSCQKIYPLLAKNGPLTLANKTLLYKTIIRPSLLYGCPVWQLISQTQRRRLQTAQNKYLRLATNLGRYADIDGMHIITKTQHVTDYIDEQAQKFFTVQISKSPMTVHIAAVKHGDVINTRHRLIHQGLPIFYEE